jgi:molybdopterin converting factor small subunit
VGVPEASGDSAAGHVRVRYWASARAAAGVEEDVLGVDGPVSLQALCEHAIRLHADAPRFAHVLGTCSFLVEDRTVGRRDACSVMVQPGETVEALPPFAGG